MILKALSSFAVAGCLACSCSSDFERLYKLEGTWEMKRDNGVLLEVWKRINATELQSHSFRIHGGDTSSLETVRLIRKEDGIFYIPTVEGQNNNQPVNFKLISKDDNRFVFENKMHDFPNRIIYTFVSADSIVARVEGDQRGAVSGSNYYFKKVK